MTGRTQTAIPRYAIVSEFDAPDPQMVCQWVPGIGYCYLDRKNGKPGHDGMPGLQATSVEAFGFSWAENRDGTVSFYLADNPPKPVTATYSDGEPRRWQHRSTVFKHTMLTVGAVKARQRADAE